MKLVFYHALNLLNFKLFFYKNKIIVFSHRPVYNIVKQGTIAQNQERI